MHDNVHYVNATACVGFTTKSAGRYSPYCNKAEDFVAGQLLPRLEGREFYKKRKACHHAAGFFNESHIGRRGATSGK